MIRGDVNVCCLSLVLIAFEWAPYHIPLDMGSAYSPTCAVMRILDILDIQYPKYYYITHYALGK